MQKIKRILSIFAAIFMATVCLFTFVACGVGEQETNDPKGSSNSIFYHADKPESVYVVDGRTLTNDQKVLISSLQGIVAQDTAEIYMIRDQNSAELLEMMKKNYPQIYFEDVRSSLWDFVGNYADIFSGKYILYNSHDQSGVTKYDQTINYATTVAGVEGYIMVSKTMENEAKEHGFILGVDVTEGYTAESIFDAYKNELNNSILFHQTSEKWELRDYAIASKGFCCFLDLDDGSSSDFDEEVFNWLTPNAPVFGWTESELPYVERNSIFGNITIPADWSSNLTFYSSFEHDLAFRQISHATVKPENDKHYMAIIMTDGDNITWFQNTFTSTNYPYYASDCRGNFPVTWTITPSLYYLMPDIIQEIYNTQTRNDEFICSPTGLGYINANVYDKTAFADYAKKTAEYMKNCDQDYITMIDSTVDIEKLDVFSQYDAIKGGVVFEGDLYIDHGGDGAGTLHWSNGKPFIVPRDALWSGANTIEGLAQKVNAYESDYTSIEGYSIIVAHVWSLGELNKVNEFVNLLDDHIKLVTVGQLLDMVTTNIAH